MPSVAATIPLMRKAVTFAFCQTARSSRRTTPTFVSNSTCGRLSRDLLRGLNLREQQMHDLADLFLEVLVVQAPVLVEACLRVSDRDLAIDHAGTHGTEHLAELCLGPHGSEHPSAGADHRDRLVA